MFFKDVVKDGHPILKKKATVEPAIGPDTDRLIKGMRDVIRHRQDAISVSAPQVGYSNRIFITKYAEIPVVIYPKLLQVDTEENIALEGCLSFPDTFINISRPNELEVAYVDALGRPKRKFVAGDVARIFMHEYEHLEGRVITDYEDKKVSRKKGRSLSQRK